MHLQKLSEIYKLRPIFGEFTLESDIMAFMQIQVYNILEGTELYHLFYDSYGTINNKDIGEGIVDTKNFK